MFVLWKDESRPIRIGDEVRVSTPVSPAPLVPGSPGRIERMPEPPPVVRAKARGAGAQEWLDLGVIMQEDPLELLEGDPMALRRLFSNLLETAVKFGGRARTRVFRDASNAFVEIEDDGPGIPPSDREKVFEPFYRREPSRSRQTGRRRGSSSRSGCR